MHLTIAERFDHLLFSVIKSRRTVIFSLFSFFFFHLIRSSLAFIWENYTSTPRYALLQFNEWYIDHFLVFFMCILAVCYHHADVNVVSVWGFIVTVVGKWLHLAPLRLPLDILINVNPGFPFNVLHNPILFKVWTLNFLFLDTYNNIWWCHLVEQAVY